MYYTPGNSKQGPHMKRGSTNILRAAIGLLGLVVLGICVFVLPQGIRSEADGDFDYGPIMIGLYVTAIPFFIALGQTFKLLNYIDNNRPFSEVSVKALRAVKYCALTISGLFLLGSPYVFHVADRDDAPGVFAIALLVIGTSFVIATSAAVLQQLVQKAIDLKEENDLTV